MPSRSRSALIGVSPVCRFLVAMGVRESGDKVLLALPLMGSESKAAWTTFVEDLATRGVTDPALVIMDGNAGLRYAVGQTWPRAAVQRCVVHKLRNLEAHAPKRLVSELRRDFHAITEAETAAAARRAYDRFRRVWRTRSESVVRSLEEAGLELLTFSAFPRSQQRSLRTTNAIERLHEEFRRRVKTQAAQPHEQSVLRLFFGLSASGQIILRKIDGWVDLPQVFAQRASADDRVGGYGLFNTNRDTTPARLRRASVWNWLRCRPGLHDGIKRARKRTTCT